MWLLVSDDRSRGEPFVALELGEGETVVGRGPGCSLLVSGIGVSRRHASLVRTKDVVEFRDLGSSAGTVLNGAVAKAGKLKAGDVLRLGEIVIKCAEAEPPMPAAAPSSGAVPVKAADPSAERPSAVDWDAFGGFVERLRRSTDPREVLVELLTGLVGLLGAERGYVLLQESEGGALVPVAAHSLADTATFVNVSRTVSKRALESGRTVFVRNTRDDALLTSAMSVVDDRPRSILCGPLVAKGQAFGVVYLDFARVSASDQPPQARLFESVTGLAAELVSAQRVRASLLSAQGRLSAMSTLSDGEEQFVFGESADARELKAALEAAASRDVTVLITGETGTGKEMVARALHRRSGRRSAPFVPVNCAALARDIIEAELFGVEKGAYTGATERRIGRFELATSGTVFLDEIGEMAQDIQTKLLRVLQEKTITRLGGTQPQLLDFRLICATNRELEQAVREGAFRSDLFYRINVFRLHLQPLRKRPDDIVPLARHFLASFGVQFRKQLEGFTPEAEKALQGYAWPGNIRELRNAVERAAVLEQGKLVTPRSLPLAGAGGVPSDAPWLAQLMAGGEMPTNYDKARGVFDHAFLRRAYDQARGNIAAIARETGVSRPTLYKWLKDAGILGDEGEKA